MYRTDCSDLLLYFFTLGHLYVRPFSEGFHTGDLKNCMHKMMNAESFQSISSAFAGEVTDVPTCMNEPTCKNILACAFGLAQCPLLPMAEPRLFV